MIFPLDLSCSWTTLNIKFISNSDVKLILGLQTSFPLEKTSWYWQFLLLNKSLKSYAKRAVVWSSSYSKTKAMVKFWGAKKIAAVFVPLFIVLTLNIGLHNMASKKRDARCATYSQHSTLRLPGGKRLRPVLTLLTARATGASEDRGTGPLPKSPTQMGESMKVVSTWVFPKIVVSPKWMVYKGKPYQNGWCGGTTILETPIYPLRNGLTQPMANLNDLFGDS